MTFESEGLLIVAICIWLPPASYVVFSDNSGWCIYLGKEGGCAVMHVYVWEHIGSLYYRTTWWMFTKLDRDEVLMILHMHEDVLAISAQGRIQGEAK